MRTAKIARVWIDESSRLHVEPDLGPDDDYAFVYRAGMGVSWVPESRSVCPTSPADWSHARWFRQIVEAVASEYGTLLALTPETTWSGVSDEATEEIGRENEIAQGKKRETERASDEVMARYVGDDRKLAEARELFGAKDWRGVVSVLESLQYPDQMGGADRKRLEIARQRSGGGKSPTERLAIKSAETMAIEPELRPIAPRERRKAARVLASAFITDPDFLSAFEQKPRLREFHLRVWFGFQLAVELVIERPPLVLVDGATIVAVLTSAREGLPRVAVQAMAAGCPMVVQDLPAIGELIVDGRNGVIVPQGDMDGTVGVIRALMRDRTRLERMAKGAAQTDVSAWSLEALGARTTALYGVPVQGKAAA